MYGDLRRGWTGYTGLAPATPDHHPLLCGLPRKTTLEKCLLSESACFLKSARFLESVHFLKSVRFLNNARFLKSEKFIDARTPECPCGTCGLRGSS